MTTTTSAARAAAPTFVWVLIAAAGTFALTMGARQSMGLFVSTLNTITGIVNAGGSFGQFVFAPIAQGITAAAGWVAALQSLAALSLLALPAAWVLRGSSSSMASSAANKEGTRAAIARALSDPSYRML